MPKKQVRNAFFFYMLDFKEEQEAQGRRRFKNLAEVAEAAGPSWQTLHPSARAQYEKKDQFQYHQYLGCAFHEDTEKYYNCCKARVKRWAFTMLDYCCLIEMVPGDHVPEEVDLKLLAQVKERLEDERERRVKESSMGFQFINYANM